MGVSLPAVTLRHVLSRKVYSLDRECLPTRIRQANRDPPGPRAATIRDFLHMREMDTDVESVDDIIEYLYLLMLLMYHAMRINM